VAGPLVRTVPKVAVSGVVTGTLLPVQFPDVLQVPPPLVAHTPVTVDELEMIRSITLPTGLKMKVSPASEGGPCQSPAADVVQRGVADQGVGSKRHAGSRDVDGLDAGLQLSWPLTLRKLLLATCQRA